MDDDTLMVEYVGLKPQETDCVAGTGITWVGLGDRHPVPASAWEIMKRHPDVWALVDPDEKPAGPTLGQAGGQGQETKPTYKYVLQPEGKEPVVLDTMDLEALKAWATANQVAFNSRTKDPAKLRAEVFKNATGED